MRAENCERKASTIATRRLPARAHFSVLLRFSIAHLYMCVTVNVLVVHFKLVWVDENRFHDWDILWWENERILTQKCILAHIEAFYIRLKSRKFLSFSLLFFQFVCTTFSVGENVNLNFLTLFLTWWKQKKKKFLYSFSLLSRDNFPISEHFFSTYIYDAES